MTTPKSILWPRDPHTEAKHRILTRYLQAWFAIIAQRFPSCTYVDAFSGPGEYAGGEPGSPVIALQVASACEALQNHPVRFVLLEEDDRRVRYLREQLAARCPLPARPRALRLSVERGTCADDLLPILSRAGAWGQPIFALLDQFGGGDVPFGVVARLAANPGSEVMVTLAPAFFTRFVTTKADLGDAVFGSAGWRAVADERSDDKHDFLAVEYRKTLRRAGFRHTLSFKMIDEGGHPLYLLFGTSNDRGLARMKDAMWKVDPVRGLSFRDPRDPAQLAFPMDKPSFEGLERFLVALVAERGACGVDELRQATLEETMYREEEVIKVLRALRDRNLLRCDSARITRKSVISTV